MAAGAVEKAREAADGSVARALVVSDLAVAEASATVHRALEELDAEAAGAFVATAPLDAEEGATDLRAFGAEGVEVLALGVETGAPHVGDGEAAVLSPVLDAIGFGAGWKNQRSVAHVDPFVAGEAHEDLCAIAKASRARQPNRGLHRHEVAPMVGPASQGVAWHRTAGRREQREQAEERAEHQCSSYEGHRSSERRSGHVVAEGPRSQAREPAFSESRSGIVQLGLTR